MGESAHFEAVAREHHAWEPATDTSSFRRRTRLLQAMWRAEQGLPIGSTHGKLRGTVVAMPFAEDTLAAFLTPTIREVVRREVLDPRSSRDKLFGKPRIFNNLLSSQPLCFNLFGELAEDLSLATAVLSELTGGMVRRVTNIDFEYSPGRGDVRFTGDRSAFDVFVRYTTAAGGRGFVGIEVKYHESLGDKEAEHRSRYDEIAAALGVFRSERLADLRRRPLQQIWRDHLLAGALKAAGGYDEGLFVFLFPKDNGRCQEAVRRYRACLVADAGFAAWTLEECVAALRRRSEKAWVEAFYDRYLDLGRVDRIVAANASET